MTINIDGVMIQLENVFSVEVDEQGHKEKPFRVLVTSTSGARKTFAYNHERTALRSWAVLENKLNELNTLKYGKL